MAYDPPARNRSTDTIAAAIAGAVLGGLVWGGLGAAIASTVVAWAAHRLAQDGDRARLKMMERKGGLREQDGAREGSRRAATTHR